MDQSGSVLRIVGNVLLHWAAIAGVASVVVHARVPWRKTSVGRHLMAYMATIAAVLVLSCIRVDIGDGDHLWFGLLRLAVFAWVPVVMTQRLWIQIAAQRANRDDEEREP